MQNEYELSEVKMFDGWQMKVLKVKLRFQSVILMFCLIWKIEWSNETVAKAMEEETNETFNSH